MLCADDIITACWYGLQFLSSVAVEKCGSRYGANCAKNAIRYLHKKNRNFMHVSLSSPALRIGNECLRCVLSCQHFEPAISNWKTLGPTVYFAHFHIEIC